jgi:phosphoribosylaminoimidazolecarboxamide formyltransferase/IMP cyclohydrolase
MARPGRFLECVVAPDFTPDALDWLTTKPTWKSSVRLVALGAGAASDAPGFDLRRVEGGLLVQDWDSLGADFADWRVVTRRVPSPLERRELEFAWRVCWAVKSNAIVISKDFQLLGAGAGQMSRLDSVRLAVAKAAERARGAILASDAFFPFRDGPDVAAAAGVAAIVQPGGSKRDDEVIAACDEHGIAMLFTGRRHFRH